MKKIVKLLGSNAFANVFSVLAFIIALLTFIYNQRQTTIKNQDTLIFTRDSAYSENVFLLREQGAYFMNVPVRVILTNRSERTHPLHELYFNVGNNSKSVKEIFDKDKKKIVLPLNIPPNESRVLFFFLRVPLTQKEGDYLLAHLRTGEGSSTNRWRISSLFDLTKVFLGLQNKMMGIELLGVHNQGTLVYHFAATRDGNPYEVKQEYYIP
jgi:hypothetical protein